MLFSTPPRDVDILWIGCLAVLRPASGAPGSLLQAPSQPPFSMVSPDGSLLWHGSLLMYQLHLSSARLPLPTLQTNATRDAPIC